MDHYLRLIAGVEIQTVAATMAAPSMVHIYISVIAEKTVKPPVTMFPTMHRLTSARDSTPGLNCRIVCASSPP